MSHRFCLVLAIWGDAYQDRSVNALVELARKLSPSLGEVVLLTDRHRPGISPSVTQKSFPDFYNRPDFFGFGYRVKIAVFHRSILPPDTPCVYLDLDTLITGDLGKIASLVRSPSEIYMLPPGNMITFSPLRRALFLISGKTKFATGNSSVLAFHSGSKESVSDVFEKRFLAGDNARYMTIDDVFISWAGQLHLRDVPRHLAASFRREFLARSSLGLWLQRKSPSKRRRRSTLVAITFNGTQYKPEMLLKLKDGEIIKDSKGRYGPWSDAQIGPLRQKMLDYCRSVATPTDSPIDAASRNLEISPADGMMPPR